MFKTKTLLVVATLVAVVGCNGPNSKYEDLGTHANTEGFGHRYSQPRDQEELVLAPGDSVSIQVANWPEFSSIQIVQFAGTIEAPFVGPVKVAGLTPTQIREKLTFALTPYITNVALQVYPINIQSKGVYIYATGRFGELVGRFYQLRGDVTLLDLITQMGGIDALSDDNNVKIIYPDPRHPEELNINIRDMIINGFTAGNIHLEPDTILFFQPNFFAQISQWINAFTLPLRTLSGALRDAATTVFFVQTGSFARGTARGQGGF